MVCGVLAPLSLYAQGINFATGKWQDVIAEANAAHKLVYVDVYTTWCGPCKILAKQIFPQKEVGDKYNALFVNYQVDAEKGEGIDLARKYEVTGYPTGLYIDPANGEVVYRTTGTSGDAAPFIAEAETAIREKNDPMTWTKYVDQFNAGDRNAAFLKAYLNKAQLLNKNNDEVLNAYISVLRKRPVSDSEVRFVAAQIMTVDNDAVAYVAANKKALTGHAVAPQPYFEEQVKGWMYKTMTRAISQKNEALIDKAIQANKTYRGNRDESINYWLRSEYFTKTGNEQRALEANIAEAGFLAGRTKDYYTHADAEEFINAKAAIRQQLIMSKVPADKLDAVIQKNIEQQPLLQRSISAQAGEKLNAVAWTIYEKHAKEPALVRQALGWSKRSLELTAGLPDWYQLADTYAHLLYVSGEKSIAMKTEQEAIDKARALKAADVDGLITSLQQMKDGKLE